MVMAVKPKSATSTGSVVVPAVYARMSIITEAEKVYSTQRNGAYLVRVGVGWGTVRGCRS